MICSFLYSVIYPVLNYKDIGGGGGWQRFYALPDHSVDVMFFGNSHAHCTVDLGYLWEQYGIKGYTLTAGAQSLDCTYYFVKEAIEKKYPKVLAVEMYGTKSDEIKHTEGDIYGNAFGMRISQNYIDFVKMFQKDLEKDISWRKEHTLVFPVTHARYMELQEEDFRETMPYLMGYRGSYERESFEKPEVAAITYTSDLAEENEYYLRQIIKIAKENNTELLLWASPYVLSEEEKSRFNMIAKIAEEENVIFVDYNNLYDELGLDFSKDYRDTGHLNNYGAVKVTDHLGKTVFSLCNISNHTGESDNKLWEENAAYLQAKVLRHSLCEAQSIQEYLESLGQMANDKTVILSLNGHYDALGDVYLPQLLELGISEEEYRQGGAFILQNGEIKEQKLGKEYSVCYKTKQDEIHLESSYSFSVDEEQEEQFVFLYDRTKFTTAENGVNIFVYDETLDFPIDFAKVDIYAGTEVLHDEQSWKW